MRQRCLIQTGAILQSKTSAKCVLYPGVVPKQTGQMEKERALWKDARGAKPFCCYIWYLPSPSLRHIPGTHTRKYTNTEDTQSLQVFQHTGELLWFGWGYSDWTL